MVVFASFSVVIKVIISIQYKQYTICTINVNGGHSVQYSVENFTLPFYMQNMYHILNILKGILQINEFLLYFIRSLYAIRLILYEFRTITTS